MVHRMIIILHIDAFLPLTEAVQAVVSMMGDFQILLIIDETIKYIKWENCNMENMYVFVGFTASANLGYFSQSIDNKLLFQVFLLPT